MSNKLRIKQQQEKQRHFDVFKDVSNINHSIIGVFLKPNFCSALGEMRGGEGREN